MAQNGLYEKLGVFMKENQNIAYCMHELTKSVNYVYPELKITDKQSRDYLYYAKIRGSLRLLGKTPCSEDTNKHCRYQFYKSLERCGFKNNNKDKSPHTIKRLIKREIYLCPHCNRVVEL